jgi:transcriptional regulator with XRE-family HTH domain
MTNLSYSQYLQEQFGNMTFGHLLRSWRLHEKITEADFAQILGLSPEELLNLEEEHVIPTPSKAAHIAQKLDVPERILIDLALKDAFHLEASQ